MSARGTAPRFRYEFRVWGRRHEAGERLSVLADSEQRQELRDRYLLVSDAHCNVKIRHNRLKVKRLIDVRFGFQRWSSVWLSDAGDSARFDRMLDGLGPNQSLPRADGRMLAGVIGGLAPHDRIRTVTVTKSRRRFRVGSVRAEASMIEIDGRPGQLRTVAIQGPDLDELVQLRSSLGLTHLPNLPLHLAIDLLDVGTTAH